MSVVWMDDPSFYNTAELSQRYDSVINFQVGVGTGRFGTGSFHAFTTGSFSTQKNLGSNITTGCIGISYKAALLPAGSPLGIFALTDGTTIQVDVRITSAGTLQVTRNGTVLATSSSSLTAGVWYRIELKTTIDPSAGVIELRVNGTSTGWVPSTGSLNTRTSSNSWFNNFNIGSLTIASVTSDYNDVVVTDNNSPNAGFLGDKRCFLRVPSSDSSVSWTPTFAAFIGTHAYVVGEQLKDSNNNVQRCIVAGTSAGSAPTWATTGGATTVSSGATFQVVGSGSNPGAHNWMAVSENPADDDSSYNADSNPGDIDAFGFPTLPAGAQNISAVDNVLRCRKDDAGVRSIATYINSGGTIVVGATIPLSSSYAYVDTINETDPNTSAAWTVSNLNAATLGYKEIA